MDGYGCLNEQLLGAEWGWSSPSWGNEGLQVSEFGAQR